MKYAPYSYSRLVLFERCPHAWYLSYDRGIKPPSSYAQKLGNVAHQVVETYYKTLINKKQSEDRELLKKIVHEFMKKENLPELVNFEFQIPPLPKEKVYIEEWIAIDNKAQPVDDNEKAFLRGKIDLYYHQKDKIVIIDWKSNLFVNPDERQLAFYAILLSFHADRKDFEFKFYSLKQNKSYFKKISKEELRPTWEWICKTIDKIETTKEWPPTPGPHCKWCGYLDMGLCPIQKDLPPMPKEGKEGKVELPKIPEIKTPQTAEEAIKLTAFLKVVEEIKERCRKALRPWVEKHGPVELNGTRFGLWEYSYTTWNTPEAKQKVAQSLLEADVPREKVWEVFNLDRRKLSSLLKREEKQFLLEEIEGLGEKATYSRLDWKSS